TPQNVPKHPPIMLSWALLIVGVVLLCVSLALFLADRHRGETAQGSAQPLTSTAKPSVSPSPDRSSNRQLPGTGPNGTVPGPEAYRPDQRSNRNRTPPDLERAVGSDGEKQFQRHDE